MRPDFAEHLKQIDLTWLLSKGIAPASIIGSPMAADELCRARVTYSQCGRFFDPCEAGGDTGDAVTAYIWVARDNIGDPADAVAWHPRTGRLALHGGGVPLVGAENVLCPRMDDALCVFDNPVSWLADGRRGALLLPGRDAEAVEALRWSGSIVPQTLALAERLAAAHESALQILVIELERRAA